MSPKGPMALHIPAPEVPPKLSPLSNGEAAAPPAAAVLALPPRPVSPKLSPSAAAGCAAAGLASPAAATAALLPSSSERAAAAAVDAGAAEDDDRKDSNRCCAALAAAMEGMGGWEGLAACLAAAAAGAVPAGFSPGSATLDMSCCAWANCSSRYSTPRGLSSAVASRCKGSSTASYFLVEH